MTVIINGTSGITDVNGSAAAPAITGTDTDTGVFFGTNTVSLSTGGTERLQVDSSGNLGLGVTPSSWGTGSSVRALQFNSGSLWSFSNTAVYLGHNYYFNGTNRLYSNTGPAAEYQLFNGTHAWNIAGSGSAGAVVTFNQAMTLDASGNLGIGATSPTSKVQILSTGSGIPQTLSLSNAQAVAADTGSSLWFEGTSSNNSCGFIKAAWSGASTNAGSYLSFGTRINDASGSTEKARIDSSGNLLVGTTTAKTKLQVEGGQFSVGSTGATSQGIYLYINNALSDNSYLSRGSAGTGTTTWYIGNQAITTSSDIRLKDNVKPTERNAVELLNQWEIIDHTWNDPSDQCENNRNSRGVWTGISAQQVQQVTPWLVNKPIEDVNEDGSINPWTMDFGYAVPLLVKAIQEQQAIITQLQADVAALKGQA